ncbi:phosphomannomutase CpsG, partial [Klebsiella pneumoniae]|nr:phosphomannomutase CpsG [Klebsiella pneumoniae]
LVREDSKPISGDSGLRNIQMLAELNDFPEIDNKKRGRYQKLSVVEEYINKIISFIDLKSFVRPLKLVINSGNGAAGHIIDAIELRFK